MPNRDMPRGFIPHGAIRSQHWYRFDTENAGTQIYPHDLCTRMGNGRVRLLTETIASTIGAALTGSCRDFADGLPRVLIADHPDQLFTCQDDGVTTAASSVHVDVYFPVVNTAPSATYNHSLQELDISIDMASSAAPGSGVLQILGRVVDANTVTSWGSWTTLVVRLPKHQLSNAQSQA